MNPIKSKNIAIIILFSFLGCGVDNDNVASLVAERESTSASSTSSTPRRSSNGSSSEAGDDEDRVVGYFTQWSASERGYSVKNIHTNGSAEKLTHIVYAFGDVVDGECAVADAVADYERAYTADESVDGMADTPGSGLVAGNFGQLQRLKAMYPHLKVLWSFGGWTRSGGFGEAARDPDKFAQSCYELVFDSRWSGVFDGIDIDWEYPNECGLSCDSSGYGAYANLMEALRSQFEGHLITAAIGAGETTLNAADYARAAQHIDFYMLMTYDFFGAWDGRGPTAPHSPLFSYLNIPPSGANSDKSIQLLKSKGVPPEKILLGIGFYGRGWTGVSQSTPGGTASGPAEGVYEAGTESYQRLKETCPATGVIAGTAYAHCEEDWWSYDTPATVQQKMQYLKQQGLGGTFFWELSGDTAEGELIEAIASGLDSAE